MRKKNKQVDCEYSIGNIYDTNLYLSVDDANKKYYRHSHVFYFLILKTWDFYYLQMVFMLHLGIISLWRQNYRYLAWNVKNDIVKIESFYFNLTFEIICIYIYPQWQSFLLIFFSLRVAAYSSLKIGARSAFGLLNQCCANQRSWNLWQMCGSNFS